MAHSDVVDIVIVGGGIIGCSVAMDLSSRGLFDTVFLLEKGQYLGNGTSTRNSYVIHAGIYYPEGSLKARFCGEGNRETYGFCEQHDIPHLQTGKLIMATAPEEIPILERLLGQGKNNGVEGLRILERPEWKNLEPYVEGLVALHSPQTGVFDTAQWFRTVEGLLYSKGVTVLKRTPVVGLNPKGDYMEVETASRGKVKARFVVNAAGLHADELASLLGNSISLHPYRGDYFMVGGSRAEEIHRAVYPVPGAIGLGIHLTKLWDGTLLIGPDARHVSSKEDYADLPVFTPEGDLDLNAPDVVRFHESAVRLFPLLKRKDMRLAHCGIRPSRLAPGEEGFRDFVVTHDPSYPQVIHLIGIDSPGLTCAMPIARYVGNLIRDLA